MSFSFLTVTLKHIGLMGNEDGKILSEYIECPLEILVIFFASLLFHF